MIRVLLDEGVPRDAAALLRELGYDCTHVGEIGMSQASDQEIIAWSLERTATVVTLDADFHAFSRFPGLPARLSLESGDRDSTLLLWWN